MAYAEPGQIRNDTGSIVESEVLVELKPVRGSRDHGTPIDQSTDQGPSDEPTLSFVPSAHMRSRLGRNSETLVSERFAESTSSTPSRERQRTSTASGPSTRNSPP